MPKTKLVSFLIIIASVGIFCGCSLEKQKEEPKLKDNSASSNPIEDAANYAPKMIDTKKKAENNIQSAVGQENRNLNDALKQ